MPTTGATPLFGLGALALDLETTGLDPARARAVQLGAVPVVQGELIQADAYEQILNPEIPIPSASTAVHGITDAMAASAPRLREVWPAFTDRIGDRIVIGHSIGFDLAVLAAEAARHRLSWRRPRSLCVRLLATTVAPALANHSLDALASWLNLEVRNRHRALGDAEAAGRIFLALIPLLQAKGIRSLAEAERACRAQADALVRHAEAEWQSPVSDAGDATFGRFDTHAYRHRVADVMARPVVSVPDDAPLRRAVEVMSDRAISSVFVTSEDGPDQPVEQCGIVTERDIVRQIARHGAAILDQPVGPIASRPIQTIRAQAFLYRAAGRMARLGLRHLGVRSDAGALVGVISARDLLKSRTGPAVELTDAIDGATTAHQLAIAWSTVPAVVRSLSAEELDASLICQIVSEEIRAMTRRAAVLAAQAMKEAGRGDPPCRFAVLVLGSGGRGESLLVPDQDNAIVFETGDPEGPADAWFAEYGKRMSDILDAAGIPYCDGGVMAQSPDWRGSTATWTARIDDWVRRSRPQDLLNVDIFFDAVSVHGFAPLGDAMVAHAYARGRSSVAFAKLLGERLGSQRSPLSMFGRLRTRDGRLDLKMHILFPVASAARSLAIRHGVVERATRLRLDRLIALGIGSDSDLAALRDAHGLGLTLLLGQQSEDIERGRKPTSWIDVSALTRRQGSDLRSALEHVQTVDVLIRDLMFETSRSAPA